MQDYSGEADQVVNEEGLHDEHFDSGNQSDEFDDYGPEAPPAQKAVSQNAASLSMSMNQRQPGGTQQFFHPAQTQ